MVPSAAASTGVSNGAGISIASCTRPSERLSENVSRNWSGRTPATGIIKLFGAVPSPTWMGGLGLSEGDAGPGEKGVAVNVGEGTGGLALAAGVGKIETALAELS